MQILHGELRKDDFVVDLAQDAGTVRGHLNDDVSRPDVVVLDAALDDTLGLTPARLILSDIGRCFESEPAGAPIRVVLVSGVYDIDQLKAELLPYSGVVNAWLPKNPFDPVEFRAAVSGLAPPVDVFISYARENRALAVEVEARFQSNQLNVIRDEHIPAGNAWRNELERHLERSRCVVVLWTPEASSSPYVESEAQYAFSHSKLFSVAVDGHRPPFMYGSSNFFDLVTTTTDLTDELATAVVEWLANST